MLTALDIDVATVTQNYNPGTLLTIDIPYRSTLFLDPSTNEPVRSLASLDGVFDSQFHGELFKLLFIGAVPGDPALETPSIINFQASYTIAGLPRPIRFLYYTLLEGMPVFTGYFGNIAFAGQYSRTIPVDPTKLVNVVVNDGIDYYIIRVTTTPNVVITNGIPKDVYPLMHTYELNGIKYNLMATANSLTDNSFYVTLNILTPVSEEVALSGFIVEPAASVADYSMIPLSNVSYKFLITPAKGVMRMDLKIVYNGPPL